MHGELHFFCHTIRNGGCKLLNTGIHGKVHGKQWSDGPKTSYSGNMAKWIGGNVVATMAVDGYKVLVQDAARVIGHHLLWVRRSFRSGRE